MPTLGLRSVTLRAIAVVAAFVSYGCGDDSTDDNGGGTMSSTSTTGATTTSSTSTTAGTTSGTSSGTGTSTTTGTTGTGSSGSDTGTGSDTGGNVALCPDGGACISDPTCPAAPPTVMGACQNMGTVCFYCTDGDVTMASGFLCEGTWLDMGMRDCTA